MTTAHPACSRPLKSYFAHIISGPYLPADFFRHRPQDACYCSRLSYPHFHIHTSYHGYTFWCPKGCSGAPYHRYQPYAPAESSHLAAKKLLDERKYRRTYNNLLKLIVQRMIEMEKLNMVATGMCSDQHASGCTEHEPTGYKMRTHIVKHLTSRSKTIQAATRRVNDTAKELGYDVISAKVILSKVFLINLDLMGDARVDIRTKVWASPLTRGLVTLYYKSLRAEEELKRVYIEVRRLQTWIRDDEALMNRTIAQLKSDGHDSLRAEISSRLALQEQVNTRIMKQLRELEQLPEYRGEKGCGRGRYSAPEATPEARSLSSPSGTEPPLDGPNPDDDHAGDPEVDDQQAQDLDGMDTLYSRIID